MRTELILAVENVASSSEWYQKLLGCKSAHGGEIFEILVDSAGTQILSLHKWGEHKHPTLTAPRGNNGNGLILYFVVEDIDVIWKNAQSLNAEVEQEPQLNANSGRMEFSLRDLDGYYISICNKPIFSRS